MRRERKESSSEAFGFQPEQRGHPHQLNRLLCAIRMKTFCLIGAVGVLVALLWILGVVRPISRRTCGAQVAAAQAQIATFQTALNAFRADTGFYPTGQNALHGSGAKGGFAFVEQRSKPP